MGTQSVNQPDEYCREIEAYLCRKNDGHLIRIVGPAFEQVAGWAREGIPLTVAQRGVDRYFERYYRKGSRRRPVRIEFCEADVRDAFDDWRRAVGVARRDSTDSGPDRDAGGRRASLGAHVERALARLTALRGSTQPAAAFAAAIDDVVRRLDAMQSTARRARGDLRTGLILELDELARTLDRAACDALDAPARDRFTREAERELAPFRGRMLPESYAQSARAAYERLVREHFGLPGLRYDG